MQNNSFDIFQDIFPEEKYFILHEPLFFQDFYDMEAQVNDQASEEQEPPREFSDIDFFYQYEDVSPVAESYILPT